MKDYFLITLSQIKVNSNRSKHLILPEVILVKNHLSRKTDNNCVLLKLPPFSISLSFSSSYLARVNSHNLADKAIKRYITKFPFFLLFYPGPLFYAHI